MLTSSAEETAMADTISCSLCRRSIQARESVIFQTDGRVAHTACLSSSREPLADRVLEPPPPDPICGACTKPIRPAESIVKDGAELVHVGCFLQRRQIAGGLGLSAWALIGDDRLGSRLGNTRAGHREFMEVCAEVCSMSAAVIARARRVMADRRAACRGSAA
jgi:hypothetical protein